MLGSPGTKPFTWANIDKDLCRHMASLAHIELIHSYKYMYDGTVILCVTTNVKDNRSNNFVKVVELCRLCAVQSQTAVTTPEQIGLHSLENI